MEKSLTRDRTRLRLLGDAPLDSPGPDHIGRMVTKGLMRLPRWESRNNPLTHLDRRARMVAKPFNAGLTLRGLPADTPALTGAIRRKHGVRRRWGERVNPSLTKMRTNMTTSR
jgi:hypothetical protein